MTKTAAVGYEVRWHKNSDPANQWSSPVAVGADGHVSVPGLERVTDYTFEARAISGCGAKSAWATQTFNLPAAPAGTLKLSDIQTELDSASAAASAANDELAKIASDAVLSPGEKPVVIRDNSVILTEHAGIDAQATAFGITTEKTAYDDACSALAAYLAGLTTPVAWNNLADNTDIDGPTFRGKFADVYTTRQTLLNAIYAAAKAKADAAQDTANTADANANKALDQLGNLDGTQYVQNPGFLAGMTGWTSDYGGWVAEDDANGPTGAAGAYAERVGSSAHPNESLRNNGSIPVYPGAVIKAQCLVGGIGSPNGSCGIRISWRDGGGGEISNTDSPTPPARSKATGNGPTGTYITGTAPAGAVGAHVECAAYNHTTGTYTVCNFAVWALSDTLDQVPDGSTRIAQPANAGAGTNVVANPSFITAAAASENAGTPYSRWIVSNNPSNVFTFVVNSNAADPMSLRIGSVTIPANTLYEAIVSNNVSGGNTFSVTPGQQYWIGGTVETYWPNGVNPGLSIAAYVGVAWFDRGGNFLSNSLSTKITSAISGVSSVIGTAVAPANSAYGIFQLKADLTTGSAAVETDSAAHYFNFGNVFCRSMSELAQAGSGQTIGDQRNLLPVTWAGVRSVLSTSPISYSISGTTVNFTVSAVTVNAGGVNVSYSASSGSVTQAAGTEVVYYLYYRDPKAAGGSQSLYITTSVQALAAYPDIVLLGSADVTVASGGGGSGGTGGGGGGFCVADEMFIGEGRKAGDADIGDPFDCIDLPTHAGKHVRALQGVTRGTEECVRMITSNGCVLVCSLSTPFDLPNGRETTAPHMLGEQVITDLGTATVTSLALVGPRPVTRAHLGGVSYAAGADPHRRIYSHNALPPSKP